MRRIYLDHAATAPMLPEVKQAMGDALDLYGNPSSMHESGRQARAAIDKARAQVAELIGANSNELIFTSSGTESNNTIISNFTCIITSAIEHPSIIEPARLKKTNFVSVDKHGKINIEEFTRLVFGADRDTLVSIMLANNEIGTIQNIQKIVKIAHEAGLRVHTDATQALGKIPINVVDLGVDFMTISAHKIGGPKGVGALYTREGVKLEPFMRGGHQESKKRAATENTSGIVGFGAAAEIATNTAIEYEQKVRPLRDKLRDFCIREFSHIRVNTPIDGTLPNIFNISFAGAEGESILLALDHVGIEASTGSACAADDIRPSYVLMAIDADPELAHGSIRFSFGLDNTAKDIEYVTEKLPAIITKLRKMSTVELKDERGE